MVKAEEVGLGDLVRFDSKNRGIILGLVMADESSPVVIRGHVSIQPKGGGCEHIVAYEDIIEVVEKEALLPKSLIRRFFS